MTDAAYWRNRDWANSSIRQIKRSLEELIETCENDNSLGDNGVIEAITEMENLAETVVLRWEKNLPPYRMHP